MIVLMLSLHHLLYSTDKGKQLINYVEIQNFVYLWMRNKQLLIIICLKCEMIFSFLFSLILRLMSVHSRCSVSIFKIVLHQVTTPITKNNRSRMILFDLTIGC
jgi:hypothetical protein